MNWTTETPTEPGYYWARTSAKDKNPMIVAVNMFGHADGNVDCYFHGRDNRVSISETDPRWQWCGPILPPQNKAISFSDNPVDVLADAVAINDDIETQSRFTHARAFCESISIMCHSCGKEIVFKENKLYAIRVPGKHFNVNGYVYYHP